MFLWMDHISERDKVKILDKVNNGKEVRIGRYFADGYCSDNKTVYEFQGCYHHGHVCELTKNIRNEKKLKKQAQKLKRTEDRIKYIPRQRI